MCVLEDVGNKNAEKTVVFMPGALGSLQTDFKPQFTEDSPFQKYRLICFEPAGYGRAQSPSRTWPQASFLQRDAADLGFCLEVRFSIFGKISIDLSHHIGIEF